VGWSSTHRKLPLDALNNLIVGEELVRLALVHGSRQIILVPASFVKGKNGQMVVKIAESTPRTSCLNIQLTRLDRIRFSLFVHLFGDVFERQSKK
jgi:hypothetical protein